MTDGRPPTQKGWHFWAFEVEDEDGGWVLCMLGPNMQAASFSVPKDSLRVRVIREFMADMTRPTDIAGNANGS